MRNLIHLGSNIFWIMRVATNLLDFKAQAGIITTVEITNPKNGYSREVKALWDTGATFSCIAKSLVEEFNLTPSGSYYLTTPYENVDMTNYILDFKVSKEKSSHYSLKVGTFADNEGFEMIVGLDMIICGQTKIGIKNEQFVFEFEENIDIKSREKH